MIADSKAKTFRRALASAAVVALIASGTGVCAAADRELHGCFVARFERFEFRDAADGATYFVVAANDEVTQRLRSMIGDSTFVMVPASMKGETKMVAAGVGPNARYRAVIKVQGVSVLEDSKLCAVKN